ncbi:MAG: DMT family transporter [Anaerolineae bacterium]|jgi:drug/metabolite transporter (DMT)-like permease|nr:DMT family transporter [Anaerolineae bacterium]
MNALLLQFGGEIAALSAAAFWAVAAIFYGRAREHIPARELNLIKGILAIILLSLTLAFTGEAAGDWNARAVVLLGISGVVGIGLGDTAYFEALKTLGVRRTLLIGILAPPLTAVIAWIFLGETLPWGAWLGIALTVLGVAWVISEHEGNDRSTGDNDGKVIAKATLLAGIGFGIAAALAQSVGAILSRIALTQTSIGALQSAILRLATGVFTMLAWLALDRRPLGGWHRSKGNGKLWGTVVLAIFMGTYLGVWLQQVAIQYAQVGTAQTLLSTSQLFILPLAALRGERISSRAIIGALVALGGVALLFQFK